MAFWSWSKTPSGNATADSTINWAEGQAPSSVNDSARAMMARTAEWRDDVSGTITTGGTSTAYTVASNQVFDTLAHMNGALIAFVPNATSTNAVGVDVTLNVDGLGAKPIRMQPSVPMPSGTLVLGTPYVVTYNNSDAVFYLRNMTNPYNIPISAGMDYWGPTTPNSSFAFPIGQAISRTTYASLFSGNPWSIGTTYGAGDGSTTFNLPDKGERVSVMKVSSASRLTSTYFGGNSTVLGAVGGLESNNVLLTHTHTGTTGTESATHTHSYNDEASRSGTSGGGGAFLNMPNGGAAGGTSGTQSANHTHNFTTNAAGSASAHNIVQPTIVCNYILRII